MKQILAQLHIVANFLENNNLNEEAEIVNNVFNNVVEAAKKKSKAKKNVPTNPSLWAECKAWAKRTFDVYPSAYANSAAAKRYKSKGGSWKKASATESFVKLATKSPEQLLSDIYETAEKINKLDDSDSESKLQELIESMLFKDKKKLPHEEDPRDLDGSKDKYHEEMDLLNHTDMMMEAEMNLEDAINNFDSTMYKVDPHGDWHENEWMPVHKYMDMLKEQYGHNIIYAPSAIDANHIAFESPDGFQIINMVHRSHWDTGK